MERVDNQGEKDKAVPYQSILLRGCSASIDDQIH